MIGKIFKKTDKMARIVKFFLICSFLLSFLVNKAGAEEKSAPLDKEAPLEITWEECLRQARQNHPDIIAELEKVKQAGANKAIAVSGVLPQISTSLSERTSETSTKDKSDTYSYSISGSQLLFDGFKTSYDIASASEDIKSARYSLAVTSSNVRLRLRTAFVRLLRAQALLNITEDIAGRRRKNLELVELRYEAGREHRGSLLTAQADLAEASFEVTQAGRNIDLAQRQLTKELGRTHLIPIKAKGDLKIKDSLREKPDFERLSESIPFLKELIARKEAARFDLESAKADFFPEVYANASAGRSDSNWPPDKDEWSVGASLSFPLFEGGSRIARVSKSKSAFNQAEADKRSGRDSLILTLEETWIDLQDAIDKLIVQQKFLEASKERARIAQAQYSTGLISFDNWIIIEDDLVRDKKSLLDAQANLLIAEANWIQAKGGTLDDQE